MNASDRPARTHKDPTSRRFVALPIPGAVRERLSATLPRDPALVDGLRWARPEGWHATLAFLGDVEDVRLDRVIAAVEAGVTATRERPAGVELTDTGTFRRKVLWIGVRASPESALVELADAIRAALRRDGFSIEDRPFRPHITLARAARRPVTRELVAACTPPTSGLTLGWIPNAVEVWRSELGDGPARYLSEATVPLPLDQRG